MNGSQNDLQGLQVKLRSHLSLDFPANTELEDVQLLEKYTGLIFHMAEMLEIVGHLGATPHV